MIIAWKIIVPLVLVRMAEGTGIDYTKYWGDEDDPQMPLGNMGMSVYCAEPGKKWIDTCPRGRKTGDTSANKVLIFFRALFSDGKNSTTCPNDAVRPFAQLRQKCMNNSSCEETVVDVSTDPGCRNRTLCLLYTCQANDVRASWHIPSDFTEGLKYYDHDPSASEAAPPALGADLSPVPATSPKGARRFNSRGGLNRIFHSTATPKTPQCVSHLPDATDYICW